jgi:PKD repeat protein
MKTKLNFYVILAVLAAVAVVPIDATADDFILHPGYIDGTVTIPDGLGGEHTIQRINVSAYGTDPNTGNSYSASTTSYNDPNFSLVVEGGDWPYNVWITAYYGDNYNGNRRVGWQRRQIVVEPNDTVTLPLQTNAFIEGTISVEGERVTKIDPWTTPVGVSIDSPLYGFESRAPFTAPLQDPNYRLPVVGGDPNATYRVNPGSVRVATAPTLTYMHLGYKETTVAPGEYATVDYSVIPGYIEGTVTVSGANQIYWNSNLSASLRVYDPCTDSSRYYSAYSGLVPDGNYATCLFPMVPGEGIEVYGYVNTETGRHKLDTQDVNVWPGETTYCNWELTLDATIGGVVGTWLQDLDYVYIYGTGPDNASRYEQTYMWDVNDYMYAYEWDGLTPGVWRLRVNVWDRDLVPGFYYDYDYYDFPEETVEVESGGYSVVDFNFVPGYITGNLLAENSASIAELYRSYIRAYPTDYPYTIERAYTDQVDYNLEDNDTNNVNSYELFVAPGDWQVRSSQLFFRHWYPDPGYNSDSAIYVNWRTWLPVLEVDANETERCDFGYQTAQIIARLRVATGEPLSSPQVYGPYLYDPDGIQDKSGSISSSSGVSDVNEGLVHLYAIPGTYRLTARAYVQGSLTTFGQPFEVTVGPGDVVVTDPDAPTVVIEFPPGYYETCEDCVVVWGTITDESGIESLTINSTPVTINEDGSYELEVCDLEIGENLIEVSACDIYGNCITIERTVIKCNLPPDVVVGGPYEGVEGSAINFDASGSSDPQGEPLEFRWDYDGDGTWDTEYSATATATCTWDDDYAGTVVVEVSDGENVVTASTTVTVSNAAPIITSIAGPTGPVSRGVSVDLTGSFTDVGILDTHTATIDWGDGTVTAAEVTESGGSGTVSGSHAYTASGEHTVTLTVEDDDGGIASATMVIVVNSPPVAALVGPCSGVEGSAITFDASGSSDPDGDPLQYRWDFDGDGTWDTDYSESPTAEYTWNDDYAGTVVVEVSDGDLVSTALASVTVANVNPTITSITGPLDPTPVGTSVDLGGAFTDPGTLDTHTASMQWGDGTTTAGTVSESGGSGTVAGSHVYTTPGVYRVTLTVTDDDGGSDSMEFLYTVVYDPTGAFVTGGGQIDSPAGAYAADPSLTGKAGFGFISKYQKGTTTPSGNTQFRFHAGDLSFKSTAYQWLVVAGARAQFKGTGTINGEGNYGFMLTAIDGDVTGGGGIDKFRIKIWDKATDTIVYDNNLGADDDAVPTTALTHGSIKIHQG